MAGGVGAEARQVDDGEFGLEPGEVLRRRADQEGADELAVPGELVDHAHAHPVLLLRAAVEVLHEQGLARRQRGEEVGLERGEMLGRHAGVVVPPDRRFRLGVADDELVLRRAAGMLAGLDHQRAVLGEQALAAAHGMLDQLGRAEVPVQRRGRRDTLMRQIERRHSGRHL